MKILFAAGDFDKQLHATNKIVYNIARSLAEKGHQCIFSGISIYDNADTECHGNLKLVRINSSHPCDKAFLALENFVRDKKLSRDDARKKFYFAHPFHSAALLYRYGISKKTLFTVKSHTRQIRALAEKEKPDILVVSYMPFDHAYSLVTEYDWDIPVIAYQLDPWGLHCNVSEDERKKRTAAETELLKKCSAVITTPVLLRQYSQHPAYQEFLDKMVALSFPNVQPAKDYSETDCAFDFDKDMVNMLFCGIVDDNFRSPEYLLNSLKSIRNSGFTRFRVHFLGTNLSHSLNSFIKDNDWVVHHSSVPLEKAFATMKYADVLINIGNTFNNQVPSKIFDYLSFGKPVLNIEKIEDCPAREYFDRYPLSLTLKEWCSDASAPDGLEDFLKNSKGCTMPYSKVEQLFSDCTLNYATDVFYDIINKI